MRKNIFSNLIFLVVISMISTSALAVDNTSISIQSSQYINYCSAVITAESGGVIAIDCGITGTGTMDTIGVKSLKIQKYSSGSWTTVKTWSSLYEYSSTQASASATYKGTVGCIYRAVIKFYASDSSGSDTKTLTTDSVTAIS